MNPPHQLPSPLDLEILEFTRYKMVIDARSEREYMHDHLPGALNLPVVHDDEYAEVGTQHRTDPHRAYGIGVTYALQNMASQLPLVLDTAQPDDRILVYCFRGGKRSRLWADALRTVGFRVDVLPGGWKAYRRWVVASLSAYPTAFSYRVLAGPTGCGKTRLLHALAQLGAQVLDLEELACHRGSLIGHMPGRQQPSQKAFDSALLASLRGFDPSRPIWVEAESKKIGAVQLPATLIECMHSSPCFRLEAPMDERVRLWMDDYSHLAADPHRLMQLLAPLKPLRGAQTLDRWRALAEAGDAAALFERLMVDHYDPAYLTSTKRDYRAYSSATPIPLRSLACEDLRDLAQRLLAGENIAEPAG